jgi:hypothetical protein
MSGPAFANNRFLPRAQPATGGPAPGGDSLVAVPNIAALVALDDTAVDDGGVVSVKSVLDLWMLDKTDVTTPIDGITSVLAASDDVVRQRRSGQRREQWHQLARRARDLGRVSAAHRRGTARSQSHRQFRLNAGAGYSRQHH